MSATALLSRLDCVRRTRPGHWIARCPAHEDRTPSLSVRELDDGRLLVYDFGGCGVEAIVAAVGLTLQDLMPPRIYARAEATHAGRRYSSRERRPFMPADVFEIARQEIGVAAVIATDLSRGLTITATDRERLRIAASRLDEIARTAYGQG